MPNKKKKKGKNGKQGEGGGRPVSIDIEDKEIFKQVQIFGGVCATHEEMAGWFDCTIRTIENYMSDQDSKFFRVYKKGQSGFKTSLRSKQRKKAFEGNTTMMIWLGKQILGQKERHDHTTNDKDIIMPILEIERDI